MCNLYLKHISIGALQFHWGYLDLYLDFTAVTVERIGDHIQVASNILTIFPITESTLSFQIQI